jgi:hypothetical protein
MIWETSSTVISHHDGLEGLQIDSSDLDEEWLMEKVKPKMSLSGLLQRGLQVDAWIGGDAIGTVWDESEGRRQRHCVGSGPPLLSHAQDLGHDDGVTL